MRTEVHLLRTATWLFSTRGFHGAGIRDIADAAGVAVSAMYYYAASKDELLEMIMKRGMDRLIDSAQRALEGVAGSSEQLATLVATHVTLHARNPHTTRVVDQEFRALTGRVRTEVLERRDAYERVWGDVLTAGVEQGEFADWGGTDRLALLQMCTGVVQWYRPGGKLAIPDLCERFAGMALALVRAQREGEPMGASRLTLPAHRDLVALVDIASEPRRRPATRG